MRRDDDAFGARRSKLANTGQGRAPVVVRERAVGWNHRMPMSRGVCSERGQAVDELVRAKRGWPLR